MTPDTVIFCSNEECWQHIQVPAHTSVLPGWKAPIERHKYTSEHGREFYFCSVCKGAIDVLEKFTKPIETDSAIRSREYNDLRRTRKNNPEFERKP